MLNIYRNSNSPYGGHTQITYIIVDADYPNGWTTIIPCKSIEILAEHLLSGFFLREIDGDWNKMMKILNQDPSMFDLTPNEKQELEEIRVKRQPRRNAWTNPKLRKIGNEIICALYSPPRWHGELPNERWREEQKNLILDIIEAKTTPVVTK